MDGSAQPDGNRAGSGAAEDGIASDAFRPNPDADRYASRIIVTLSCNYQS